jgi:hypothetical protein
MVWWEGKEPKQGGVWRKRLEWWLRGIGDWMREEEEGRR